MWFLPRVCPHMSRLMLQSMESPLTDGTHVRSWGISIFIGTGTWTRLFHCRLGFLHTAVADNVASFRCSVHRWACCVAWQASRWSVVCFKWLWEKFHGISFLLSVCFFRFLLVKPRSAFCGDSFFSAVDYVFAWFMVSSCVGLTGSVK